MMRKWAAFLADTAMLLRLSLRLQIGRWAWLVPVLALLWPLYHEMTVLIASRRFDVADAQNSLIGVPLFVLAIGLGVRVIAAEIDHRTLEIAYTVPGGSRRVWVAKLAAAAVPLLAAALLLAIIAAVFFVRYPISAFYGALQGTAFYLVLAAGLGALLRNEITAALVASVMLALNGFLTSFGGAQSRWSPLFNPLAVKDINEADIFGWTVQNRIGFALLILLLVALTCARTERREQLLNMS